MRSLTLALALGSAALLQACAGAPQKQASESDQIVDSILDPRLFEEQSCPARTARYCTGSGFQLNCNCVTPDTLRRQFGGGY